MTARWPVLGALLVLLVASPLFAQRLSGVVRDSASRAPLSGVALLLIDSAGAITARGLTGSQGQFSLPFSRRDRTLRLLRLGFRPQQLPLPRTARDSSGFNVSMSRLPTILEPVAAVANSACPARGDAAVAFALLEQARAGLLGAAIAADADSVHMTRLRFDRLMDGTSDRIERQSVRLDSVGHMASSFAATYAAADFVRRGFMSDSAGAQTFFAPDVPVLIDPAFAEAYCFRIVDGGASRKHDVGLGFEPASRRRTFIDVDGVLWIDTVARVMRSIEFRYLGLPETVSRLKPGGIVSFREARPGFTVIDRWSLHLIGASEDTVPNPRPRGDPIVRTLYYVREVGGVLAHARWPDGAQWNAHLGVLRGRATAGDGAPAKGAVIRLVGARYRKGVTVPEADTPYRVTVDSTGQFVIVDLVSGPYSIEIDDPRLAPIQYALPTGISFTAVDDSEVSERIDVPSLEEFVLTTCLAFGKFTGADSLLVLGRVVDARGSPISDVDLTTSWSVTGSPGTWIDGAPYRGTGTDGLFFMCQKPIAAALPRSLQITARRHDRLIVQQRFVVTGKLTIALVRGSATP